MTHNADKVGRLRPPGAPHLTDKYRDWRDFTDRVCRPWIDNDGLDDKAEAWYSALFATASPYYLATALVMADNSLRRYEASPNGRSEAGEAGGAGIADRA